MECFYIKITEKQGKNKKNALDLTHIDYKLLADCYSTCVQ